MPFVKVGQERDERLTRDLTVVEIPDGPHNIGWTFPDEVNAALLDFLGGDGTVAATNGQGAVATGKLEP